MRIVLILAVSASVLTATGAAAEPDAVDQRAPLIGHVLDRHGHGVRHVCVDALSLRDDGHYWTESGRDGRFILDTRSWRPEAWFHIRLVPCDSRLPYAPEYSPHANTIFSSTAVKVVAGHNTHRDFVLRDQGIIVGTLSGALDRPMEGGCILTNQWSEEGDGPADDTKAMSVTDASGQFRLHQRVVK
jgi:hypothetical protein